MQIEQSRWTAADAWGAAVPGKLTDAQLVLAFGGRALLEGGSQLGELRESYPHAHFMGCSTAGEICGSQVTDDSLVATAIRFEHTRFAEACISLADVGSSLDAGRELAGRLGREGLRHVFVLSDGLNVNGSDLTRGLTEHLPEHVTVTGGLSGDGARFERTMVLSRCGGAASDLVSVIGLYSDRLKVGYGSLGGWDSFGPERVITRSTRNVLYELDGKSALELYQTYLGEHAAGLPATGLLFPLSVRERDGERGVVRTILAVDDDEESMTFAGDVPEGHYARLMKANFDRLVDGAAGAARTTHQAFGDETPELAVLISCVGRKMVLKQRIEEEVEAVREVLGDDTVLTGFYSYGEISPFTPNARCELHNQTMTITTLSER